MEFQQFQKVCFFYLCCSRSASQRLVAPRSAGGVYHVQIRRNATLFVRNWFSVPGYRTSVTHCKESMDFRPVIDKLAERGNPGPTCR